MLDRFGIIVEKLFGPLSDRISDRVAERLEKRLPDLSDLDDQIVAKLPDLSNLPKQVADAITGVFGAAPLGAIQGGIESIIDGIFGKRQ
ncbi:hypothetical protein [Mycolicibacterium sp.]|uniref:hypothetical protein n=1 Tax=Mycolicibacterium sp. TaxID=2320850 RepID=UPI0037C9C00F